MNWQEQVLADGRKHEGYRQYAYPDVLSKLFKQHPKAPWGFKPARSIVQELGGNLEEGGPWTVGYGYTHGVTPDTEFSKGMAEHKLVEIMSQSAKDAEFLVPNFKEQPDVVKTVLVSMAYNMGRAKLATFRNTLRYFFTKNYVQAAAAMEKSLWYRQVGHRAKELVKRVRTLKIEE